VVRRDHYQNSNNNNKDNDAKRRSLTAGGSPSILVKTERGSGFGSLLAKWKIRHYARHIRIVHTRCFAQPPFALCIFSGQQMASRRVRSQHFAPCRDFETFGYCFACFASRNWLRHKAANIIRYEILTTGRFGRPSQQSRPNRELNVGR
jgi:hypothetical protein